MSARIQLQKVGPVWHFRIEAPPLMQGSSLYLPYVIHTSELWWATSDDAHQAGEAWLKYAANSDASPWVDAEDYERIYRL
tara:strand:+ start:701 stop:940 length:240 start_codon:yes stop_codon:yes gene_type:complete